MNQNTTAPSAPNSTTSNLSAGTTAPSSSTTTTANPTIPNPSSTTSTGASSTNTGTGVGHGIKNAFAAVHGAGEAIRGTVNSKVDEVGGDSGAKNRAVAQGGINEMDTGEFTSGTKQREGVVPGDKRV